ncbi:MAG: iron ABC transporter permease [Acutalibacteraceae bacterium]|jgi:iron complex transport system permease protein|nr:iron ABC transporter permease [Clostridiales bacterium]
MFKRKQLKFKTYEGYIRYKYLVIIFLIALCVFFSLLSISWGSSNLSISEVAKTLVGQGDKRSESIVFKIRLPRVVTAIVAGGILAMSGCVMQSVLRNPLASDSTLGISHGASFGAAVAIIAFGAGVQGTVTSANAISVKNPSLVVLCAFMGGIFSTLIILGLSRFKRLGPESVILAGVALSSMFIGGTTLIQYFADDVQVAAVVFWTFGDLGRTNWTEIKIMSTVGAIAFIYFMYNRWNYNVMESGVSTAKSLGVNTTRVMITSMTVASLATSVVVSFVGIISFVGLIAPHMLRKFVGNDYRFLLPASALSGTIILLLSDLFARYIVAPVILPIGAITSFLGAPMFLYILFKGVAKR